MNPAGNANLRPPSPLSKAKHGIFVVGVFSFFVNLLMLVSPIFSLQVFDRVLTTRSFDTLVFLTAIAVFAIGVLAILDGLRSAVLSRIGRWFDNIARGRILSASILLTLRTGNPVTHGFQDLQTFKGFLMSNGPLPLFDAPWVPVFILVLTLIHPWIGALAFGTATVLFALALLNSFLSSRALSGISEAQLQVNSAASLAIRHADTIQTMGMQNDLLNRYVRQNDVIQSANQRAADSGSLISSISKFIRIGAQIGVMALGAWLVILGQMTPGGMIAGSILLGRALAPVEQAIGAWRSFIAASEAFGRLRHLMETADDVEEVIKLPAPKGEVSIEQVSFVPPNAMKPILQGISFDLPAGTALSIIGPSAAGKSTLCRLLAGSLKPSTGHVRLDSHDVYRWDRSDIGRHIGYVSQSVELFAGTVKENIARLGEVNETAVVEAAILAGCDEMIRRLPQGYETNVGDNGVHLSGGQRQRIGLARALYGNPTLVVLDEPDSNLDDLGTHALVEAITRFKSRGSTVICVTHRPALTRVTDMMLVISGGRMQFFDRTPVVIEAMRQAKQAAGVPQARSAAEGEKTA